MRIRRTRAHDVGSGRLVRGWQPRSLGIERPHDHPVWTDSNGWARFIIRIGIAALRSAGEHVGDSRNAVRWLRLVGFEVGCPLHGRCVCAHGRFTDHSRIARHTSEAVRAFSENYHFPVRVGPDNPRGFSYAVWSSGYFSDGKQHRVVICRPTAGMATRDKGPFHVEDERHRAFHSSRHDLAAATHLDIDEDSRS
jgi:hypothetical protein